MFYLCPQLTMNYIPFFCCSLFRLFFLHFHFLFFYIFFLTLSSVITCCWRSVLIITTGESLFCAFSHVTLNIKLHLPVLHELDSISDSPPTAAIRFQSGVFSLMCPQALLWHKTFCTLSAQQLRPRHFLKYNNVHIYKRCTQRLFVLILGKVVIVYSMLSWELWYNS